MKLDLNCVTPSPAGWFSPSVQYEGRGQVQFADPKGTAEGPARVRFDEFGESSVELDIETHSSERPLHFGLFELISGVKPVEGEKCVTMGFGGMDNSCTKLTVTTTDGVFTAVGKILYGLREHPLFSNSGKLELYPLRSQFDPTAPGTARYWVVPVFNLLSEFAFRHPSLDRHPLRIFPTPIVPAGLSKEENVSATFKANEKNKLIVFESDGELCFVEALPDFEDRKKKLMSRRERTMVTAVMVGAAGPRPIELADLQQWSAFDLLSVLGVATGIEVGAPWVELRDAQGKLVRRLHMTVGQPQFSYGRAAIREGIHGTAGHLLNKYQSSPGRGKPHLLASMNYLIKAGRDGLTLEDRFDLLCRGFENLCDTYGVTRQDLLRELDSSNATKVKEVLEEGANQIRSIAAVVRASDFRQSSVLERIAERTKTTPIGVDRIFGLAVTELLKRFSLPDAEIAEKHYATNPSLYASTWAQKLSYYRGACLHRGYLDLQDEKDLHRAYQLILHLHDILLRLILNMVGYDGTYQPMTITLTAAQPVDWVKPDTSPQSLGYT